MNENKFFLRKISLSEDEFNKLRNLVFKVSGISLAETKKELVISRFSRRVKSLKLNSFNEYYNLLVSPSGFSEVQNFINSITTNKTDFFRETHHFDYLASEFIPEIIAKNKKPVRIWSAACSTGEEPYTIAMVMHKHLVEPYSVPVKIYASDIDTAALKTASAGVYDAQTIAPVPEHYLKRYFLRGKENNKGLFKIKNEIREMITFKKLNFVAEEYPIAHTFDVVFCRNVIIYFNAETKKYVVSKIFRFLNEGGYLMMGHSESLFNLIDGLVYLKNTIYKKQYINSDGG